ESETYLNYIKFRVVETNEEIIIATTRPELLPACVAVIYNPQDDRYKHLAGKHAEVPIFGQIVPILEHPAAKPEYGTGLVMICTFGDVRDLMIVNDLKLPIRIVIDETGRLKDVAGKFSGMYIIDARYAIIEELKNRGLLVKQEKVKHNVPVCWRCKTPVEIIITREYFLKQLEFKDKLVELVRNEMIFYPPEFKEKLISCIESLEFDWPISRRRYYATEIPIWYCIDENGNKIPLVPEPGRYYRPWRDEPPREIVEKCPTGRIEGETRVLDTWFDSSISWMYASGYTKPEINVFDKVYPHSIMRPQGYDIIRTWLYYSVLRAYLLYGKPPFRYVRISGMGLDEKGEAMHKSKGNIIDPIPPVEKYGADAVRFWAAAAAKLGSDYRFMPQLVETGHSFVIKLWNIARFISQFPIVLDRGDVTLTPLDMMILAKLEEVIAKCVESYSRFDVYEPAHTIFDFTWHIFADHYLEAVKPRAYNREGYFSDREQKAAWFTLHTVLREITKLAAPIMPFVTDYIWRKLYNETVHRQNIPDKLEIEFDRSYGELIDLFTRFNRAIWTYKNKHGMSLASPLEAVVYVPDKLQPLIRELKIMHKIREIRIGQPEKECEKVDESEIYICRE
ncbi:MAG: class I tRNA ligase family protein, partial [Crenarchaeota archaeon]|nr:class I tRNA ligase family protein [Thermoproteota archaeon]